MRFEFVLSLENFLFVLMYVYGNPLHLITFWCVETYASILTNPHFILGIAKASVSPFFTV
jgi:hypothetical protein